MPKQRRPSLHHHLISEIAQCPNCRKIYAAEIVREDFPHHTIKYILGEIEQLLARGILTPVLTDRVRVTSKK